MLCSQIKFNALVSGVGVEFLMFSKGVAIDYSQE